ncbi:TonB-dependent receptor [Paenimyroides tangerinum]|nr:TonB-dependent receptor [Paenimyroides tangerinum]
MYFKRFFLITLVLIVAQVANAQYKLSGTVFDGSGNSLNNAEVKLVNSTVSETTLSNTEGKYHFSNISNGSYQLIVSIYGYKEFINIEIANSDLSQDLVLFSYNTEESLEDMVINFVSAKSEIEKSGFAVNVIETKDAALRNIQTNELLDRSVGVRVRQNGGLGSSVNYNLNGLSGNAIKIFVDGIPISTYGPSFSLNSIPPALIERIEVYKGVVPIYLSEDALGGAINVVLKNGLRNSLNASLSYGSFNTTQANFNGIMRRDSGFTVKASGFLNNTDNDYEVWGNAVKVTMPNGREENVRAKRFNDSYRSIGGQVEAGFTDVSWADHFFVGFNASDVYNEIQHGTYMRNPYKGRFVESESQVISLNYKKEDFLVDGLKFGFTATHSNRAEVVNDTVKWVYNWLGEQSLGLNGEPILTQQGAQQGAPTILHSKRKIYSLRANLAYEFLPNQVIAFNQLYNSFDRKDNDEMKSILERNFIDTRKMTKSISSFAYEAKFFDSKFKTNFFTKIYNQKIEKFKPVLKTEDGQSVRVIEESKNQFNYVGYGGAFSYLIRPAIIVMASAEKAIRMPSESETFGEVGENIVENFGLKAEVSNNFNLGFKIGPYKNTNHSFSFGASGFFRDTKDKISKRINSRLNDAEQVTPFENLQKTKTIGYEAEFTYIYKEKLNFLINATKFNTLFNRQFNPEGKQYDYYNQQVPNEPFFTINASVQYMLKDLVQKNSILNLYYNYGYVESFYVNWLEVEQYRTLDQNIHDVGLSYVFPNKQFVLSFDAKNILNNEAYDNFAVQKPGRAFYMKINYTFNKF